jgi:hypothetical protein
VVADAPTSPGTERTWQVSVFPVSRQAGRVTGVGLLSRDITDKKNDERARACDSPSSSSASSLTIFAILLPPSEWRRLP